MSEQADVAKMISAYEPLIRAFIEGTMSGSEFQLAFFEYFKNDPNQVRSQEFEVLDSIFGDVDEYVADPELRAREGGPGDDWLKKRLQIAYRRLYGREVS